MSRSAPLAGCASAGARRWCADLLRSPVYDTSAADGSSSAATRREPPTAERNLPCRRSSTTSSAAPSTSSGTSAIRQRPGARPLSDAVAVQHRRGRLRAHGLRDRRRARLRHARAGARRARSPRCASSATRRRGRSARGMTGLQGILLPLPRHEDRRSAPATASCRRSTPRCCSAACCTAQAYFDGDHPDEARDPRAWSTRSTGASTGTGRRCAAAVDQHGLEAGERASSRYDWRGYNEAMLVVPPGARLADAPGRRRAPGTPGRAATSGAWGRFMGSEHLSFAPLFGHQYSHVWIDFRGIQDATMRAARHRLLRELAPRRLRAARLRDRQPEGLARATAPNVWGLTACDGPARCAQLDRGGRVALLPRLLGARRRPLGTDRRRHHRADRRRRRRSPFAPEIVDPGDRGDARALRQVHLLASTASSIRSTAASPSTDVQLSRRPRRSRRSAGSPRTTSASTRARSWR